MATSATPVLGIGNPAMTLRYGTISVKFKVNNKFITHKLQHTLYIPEAPNCLLSASRFDETGGKVIIQKGKCSLEDKNRNTVRHGDETALSLASEITKLHNSSQLRSYTNYYDHWQVILTAILRLQSSSTLHRL